MHFKKLILSTFFALSAVFVQAQKFLEFPDEDSTETLEELQNFSIRFMEQLEFDSLADIGSGNMELILKFANKHPEKRYFLEDIDSNVFNRDRLQKKIESFDLNDLNLQNISLHYGTTDSTFLPTECCDLVVLNAVFHELSEPDQFLQELQRIVKPGGSLLISDAFYEKPPGLHQGCDRAFLSQTEFQSWLNEQKFEIKRDWRVTGLLDGKGRAYHTRFIQCVFLE